MSTIYVNRQPVGELTRDERAHRFNYAPDVTALNAVSLLMPVQNREYLAEEPRVLHPVFDMCLPEGALRQTLTGMFAKALPVFDDFELFKIVGRSTIGKLRCVEHATQLDIPAENLRALLESQNTSELFTFLLRRYASLSGVSGVQPKILIRDDGSLVAGRMSTQEKADRLTMRGATHLLKSFDPRDFPGLAVNEYLCLQAARAAGLETVNAELSGDGRVLVIERFDRKAAGDFLGFEDGCALAGMISRDKYVGSYEQLAVTLASTLNVPDPRHEMGKFFRSLVLSSAVRNGDAHRKNFGLLYDDPDGTVTLAPAYDIITSTAYIKEDSPALLMDGSKRWPDNKRLEKFARTRCDLGAKEAQAIMAEVADGVARTMDRFSSASLRDLDRDGGETIDRMARAWREGLNGIRPTTKTFGAVGKMPQEPS